MGTATEIQSAVAMNHFEVTVSSSYDRHDADIQFQFQSTRPEKKLAELTLLECNFLAWARQKREELAIACDRSGYGG